MCAWRWRPARLKFSELMCVFPPRSLRWRLIQGWHIKELCWAGQMHEWNLLLRCFIPRLLRPWCTRTNTQGKIKTENTISDSRFGESWFFQNFSCICQMKVLLMYMFYSLLIKLMTLALLTCSGSLVAQCKKHQGHGFDSEGMQMNKCISYKSLE